MFALSGSTGFRKSEVALPNGEDFDDRCLRRALLLWKFDEAPHADPSSEPLRTLLADRDKAVIKPICSKLDQDGIIWGAHPVWPVFNPADVATAAARHQRTEPRFPCPGL